MIIRETEHEFVMVAQHDHALLSGDVAKNTDYPSLPKVTHYQYGLDQVEKMNKYAGLLCSMHYYSFGFQDSTDRDCIEFAHHEKCRQKRIRDELNVTNDEAIIKQFRLLQLCDRISLYVCLNNPGVSKEQEHPPFKIGFEDSELFNMESESRLVAKWMNTNEIQITPNPFISSFRTSVRQKRIPKQLLKDIGIANAYKNAEWIEQEVTFTGRS